MTIRHGALASLVLGLAACAQPNPLAGPPAEPAAPGRGPAYRLAAIGPLAVSAATADSSVSTNPPRLAIDGNLASAWTNGGYRNPTAWLRLDLGVSRQVSALRIKMPPATGGSRFAIEASATGTSWTTVLANQATTSWNLETKTFPAPVSARYLRVWWWNSSTSPLPHVSIFEAQPLGEASGATPSPSASQPASPTPAPSPTPTSSPTPAPTPSASATPITGWPSAAQAAALYAAHFSFFGSGMAGPNGLALDRAGSLYEADWNRGSVTRVTQAGVVSRYASGISGAAGLAFDAAGNLYCAAYNSHQLLRIPPGGGSWSVFASGGLNRPVWPAIDSRGRIYLADYSNNRIALVSSSGQISTFKSMSGVNAIAIDNADNLWVCTWGGTIAKITPTGATTTIASGYYSACAIAWSPGYLGVCTYGGETQRNGRTLLFDFQGKSYVVATGQDRPSSCIFDANKVFYTANIGDTALRRYRLQ